MDVVSVLGVLLGIAALFGGNFLEGGSWQSLFNGSAAIVVIGGTLGAAMLQTPWQQIQRAWNLFPWVFIPPQPPFKQGLQRIVGWSNTVRKQGLLELEKQAEHEPDLFTRKGLQLLVDGNNPEAIRQSLENDMLINEQRDLDAAKFFESMGGYAPTIGIIGAVLGLIHVMRNLADPTELGPGIAIAFVATIYGVAFANLLLLPVAHKIRSCVLSQSQYRELMIEGLSAIAAEESPRYIRLKLEGYVP